MFHIAFYVPRDHKELVKEAMFKVGAGKIGNYEKCCFESEGWGQFCALKGSQPFIGEVGKLEKVREVKVEMVCSDDVLDQVVREVKRAHPYEEPAYYMISIVGQ